MRRRSVTLRMMSLLTGLITTTAYGSEQPLKLPSLSDSRITLTLQQPPSDSHGSQHLRVFVGGSDRCCENRLPIAGHYHFDDNTLTFTPDFAFILGQKYTVMTNDHNAPSHSQHHEFSLTPQNANAIPTVTGIYPSGSSIPENTLRFYIHFSHPMEPHKSGIHSAYECRWRR